jgi:hypothetical protein
MKLPMKLLRIVGLCLTAMFAVSMFASAAASAAPPAWEQCSEGPATEPITKYSEHQCTKAEAPPKGRWQWNELASSENIKIKGSLLLKDTKTAAGVSEVECSGESLGSIGPGKSGRITEVKTSAAQCRQIKVCENVEGAEAVHTPWSTEVVEEGGKVFDKILSGTGGEPGWKVTCKVPILGSTADECTQKTTEPESVELINKATGSELLVLGTFAKKFKAKCTVGGAKSGEVVGSLAILKENGWALRVS